MFRSDSSACIRTTDPTLSFRWARVGGELVIETTRGTFTPESLNLAADRGERDAVLVQHAIGGGR